MAGGIPQIIAGGGDGTLRDIAEALAAHPSDASLVLLPLGTANDFASAAGVPLEPAEALELLDVPAAGTSIWVEVGGQIFLNMATGGFGSQVTANTSEDLKKVLGGAAYLFTGLSRFSELHAAYGELQGPDFHWSGELLALGIGNGRQAGGGHVLCPQALADDGLLDISILPAPQELVGTLKNLLSDGFGIDNMFVRTRLPWVEIKVAEGLVHQSRWRAAGRRQPAVRGAPSGAAGAFAGGFTVAGASVGQSSRLMICSRTANNTRPATS